VLGPESSGTRMLTEFLMRAGCCGDCTHTQLIDHSDFRELPRQFVLRRSLPHGEGWPDIQGLTEQIISAGYAVEYLVILRDKDYCVASQIRSMHEEDERQCRYNILHALEIIFEAADALSILPEVVLYEPFVRYESVRRGLVGRLRLNYPEGMVFVSGNDKYEVNRRPNSTFSPPVVESAKS
jgi:hypothetical protein